MLFVLFSWTAVARVADLSVRGRWRESERGEERWSEGERGERERGEREEGAGQGGREGGERVRENG